MLTSICVYGHSSWPRSHFSLLRHKEVDAGGLVGGVHGGLHLVHILASLAARATEGVLDLLERLKKKA